MKVSELLALLNDRVEKSPVVLDYPVYILDGNDPNKYGWQAIEGAEWHLMGGNLVLKSKKA